MSGKTYLAILGGRPTDYDILDKHINKLIEESQCYLFTILCASKNLSASPLSFTWAQNNGCPVEFLSAEDSNKLINKLFNKATYIIFILHEDDVFTKRLFMKYKMLGKHGSVIKL